MKSIITAVVFLAMLGTSVAQADYLIYSRQSYTWTYRVEWTQAPLPPYPGFNPYYIHPRVSTRFNALRDPNFKAQSNWLEVRGNRPDSTSKPLERVALGGLKTLAHEVSNLPIIVINEMARIKEEKANLKKAYALVCYDIETQWGKRNYEEINKLLSVKKRIERRLKKLGVSEADVTYICNNVKTSFYTKRSRKTSPKVSSRKKAVTLTTQMTFKKPTYEVPHPLGR